MVFVPSLSCNPSIVKHLSYFLFCLNALQIYLQFIEGEMECDINSDREDGDLMRNLNEADDLNVDSLHLSDEVIFPSAFVVIKEIQGCGKWCMTNRDDFFSNKDTDDFFFFFQLISLVMQFCILQF